MKRKPKKKHAASTALVLVPREALTTRKAKHKRAKRKRSPMAMPPALARWHREHPKHRKHRKHHKSKSKRRPMAKSKSRSRSYVHRARRSYRRHRRAIGGALGHFVPTLNEAVQAGTAALYGKFEGDAAKDQTHFLRSIPAPLAVVGRTGNIALAGWILGAVTKQPLIRSAALGLVDVAAYQMTRRPSAYTDKDVDFKLAGSGTRLGFNRVPAMVDRYLNGAGAAGDDDDDDDGAGC